MIRSSTVIGLEQKLIKANLADTIEEYQELKNYEDILLAQIFRLCKELLDDQNR